LLIQKCQDFRGCKAFVSAIFEFVKFPTRYEWSNIRGTVQLIGDRGVLYGTISPIKNYCMVAKCIWLQQDNQYNFQLQPKVTRGTRDEISEWSQTGWKKKISTVLLSIVQVRYWPWILKSIFHNVADFLSVYFTQVSDQRKTMRLVRPGDGSQLDTTHHRRGPTSRLLVRASWRGHQQRVSNTRGIVKHGYCTADLEFKFEFIHRVQNILLKTTQFSYPPQVTTRSCDFVRLPKPRRRQRDDREMMTSAIDYFTCSTSLLTSSKDGQTNWKWRVQTQEKEVVIDSAKHNTSCPCDMFRRENRDWETEKFVEKMATVTSLLFFCFVFFFFC
jgi:hypothetical protein